MTIEKFTEALKAYGRAVFTDRSVDDMNQTRAAVLALYAEALKSQADATDAACFPNIFDSLLYAKESAKTSDVEAGYASLLRRLSAHDMRLIRDAMLANKLPPRGVCMSRCPTEVRPCRCFPFTDDCYRPDPVIIDAARGAK